jgi:hypothetical protein
MRRLACIPLLLSAALVGACGDAGSPAHSGPGMITLALTAPSAGDHALLLTVSGPAAPTAVTAAGPGYVVRWRATGSSARVAVFGAVVSGPLITVTIPDQSQAARYSAVVNEAADAANVTRTSVVGYTLAVSR